MYLSLCDLIKELVILHSNTSQGWNNLPLFFVGEKTGYYSIPETSVIANVIYVNQTASFDLVSTFKVVNLRHKVRIPLIY